MPETRPPNAGPINRSRLLRLIKQSFEVEDLRLVCFELDIAFGNLGSATRDGKAADLIDLARANNMLPALVSACRALRPGVDWSVAYDATPPPIAPAAELADKHGQPRSELPGARAAGDGLRGVPPSRTPPADASDMIRIPREARGDALIGMVVDEFLIDAYPVTIGQYALYLDATGARPPRSWSERGRPAPTQRNHPVTDVSWLDASAYCEWLGKRLPTTLEWEIAACGAARRKYPWGDVWAPGQCNTAETGLGATTPVDRYPGGVSPYGVFDMVGNVWEWSSSEVRSRVIGRAGTQRALKGGSFRETRETAHCRAQIQRWPEDSADDVGFRCAW